MWRINLCNLINDFIFLFPDVMLRRNERKSGKGVFDSGIMQRLNITGIPRMSSVTIFQSDQFVLLTIYYSNLTFRSP